MARLLGYLRVSTDEQSIDSSGQRHAIETWAAREGHEIVQWFDDDGISGSKGLDRRRGLAAAFDLCSSKRRGKGRIDGIVALNRSRLARGRDLAGMLRWTARSLGFCLRTVDGLDSRDESFTAAAQDVLSDMVSEQTREAIRTATRAALAARRDNGLVAGHVPYGYTREGARLVSCAAEQAIVSAALDLRARGLSLRAIARSLNDSGSTTRTGSAWGAVAVQRVLAGRAANAA